MTEINEQGYAEDYPEEQYEGQPEQPTERRPQPVIPLGEVETEDTITENVVGYTRQANLGDRDSNAWAKCELHFPVQLDWGLDQIAVQATGYMNTCVSVVCEQLGLPVVVTESGVVREAVHTHFPDAEQVADDGVRPMRRERTQQRPQRGGGQRSSGRSRFPSPSDMDKPEHIDIEDWEDLCVNPGDWYDNRADKAAGKGHPQQPDFRHKQDGTGLWLRPYSASSSGRGRRN